uniref:Uncharacterized protein n=1 Tax=Geospiza parvula TaxID=87175 RepID=A0A8U8B0F0_GEOPR
MAAPRVSLGALKEPLGLSRGLQWFFSIFAFATCGGFEGSVTFSVTCAGGDNATRVTNVTAAYGYPFRLNQAVFQPSLTHLCNHTWPRDVHLVGDFSSASRFFVGVAVGAFLYSLGALGLYLGYLHLYRCAGSRLPLLDLLLSCLGAALWLGASCAWAQALGHVRRAAAAPLPHCPGVTCARAPRPWGGWARPWPSGSSTSCSGPAAPGSSTRRRLCTARPRPPSPAPPPCDHAPPQHFCSRADFGGGAKDWGGGPDVGGGALCAGLRGRGRVGEGWDG